MIKKLRIRFILISMISVFVVLFATISIINVSNYVAIENDSKEILVEIINEGIIEEEEDRPNDGGPGGEGHPGDDKKERVNENHFYIVAFNQNGEIEKSNYRHIFSINEVRGNELATSIYQSNVISGKNGDFRYLKEYKSDGYTYVAVLDIKEKLDNFNKFLLLSSTISIGGYVTLLGLIIFASYIAFKPSIESYQKQKQFITNASHELKTPLTIISTDLDILEMDHGKSEWSESIRDQVARLTNMTNQLVTLSKLEENDLKNYPFSDFSINEVINKANEYFAPSFKQAHIDYNVEANDAVTYYGNRYLFEELFYIFLDNSLKYTDGNNKFSKVTLVKDKKDKFHIVFTNSINEHDELDPNLVTERFYRSPTNKKDGSGIGLSIAKEIINLHKGKLITKKDNNTVSFELYF